MTSASLPGTPLAGAFDRGLRGRDSPKSAAIEPSRPGQDASQRKVTALDTDTPKGTALMSWWPTLEWPDVRQFEIALEVARVSSATAVGMFGFQAG